jgi:hypothetical protein
MSADDAQADLLRKFRAAIAGVELADLRQVAADLGALARGKHVPLDRPELRRPALAQRCLFRIRVDLDTAQPPIWRRLELRSDLTLDVVHQALQAAFDWTDSHLYRFSLGGGPFDAHSQLFLCPWDAEEGEDDGEAAAQVRLDETVQEAGDVLQYIYDYGDSWELTLRLEGVRPAAPDSQPAIVLDGRRAAPPEDCGGMTDAEGLAEVLDDPAHFDLDALNEALRGPFFALRELGVDPRLVDLVNRLRFSRVGDDVAGRAGLLIGGSAAPAEPELSSALRAHRWFLDRAADGGIPLTAAGYLKPADVLAACEVVPAMSDWIGENNREANAFPLLEFRQSLQSMGLLRKYKGRLMLTKAGAAAQRDPARLWDHLASRLLPGDDDGFATPATLLLLLYAATSADADLPLDRIAAALTELGWGHTDHRPVGGYEIRHLAAFDVLANMTDGQARRRAPVSAAAASLARAALSRRR